MVGKKRSGFKNDRRAYGCSGFCLVQKYTVTYNGNNSTSGAVPIDSLSPYTARSIVTVRPKGTLARAGYIFSNWTNGLGQSYLGGSQFQITSNTILYAQWVQTFTVTYNGNGNTSGTVPTDTLSPYIYNSSVTVLPEETLARNGYAFTSWNTLENGTGTAYNVNDQFQITTNTILYAQWVQTFTVTYNGNDSTSGTVPTDTASPYQIGSPVTVLPKGTLERIGYAFNGWFDGGNSYDVGDQFQITTNTILYAQWIETFTVTYNGNNSTSGTVPTDTASPYESGSTVTVRPKGPTLERTGYAFTNWNTLANGTGTAYNVNDEFQISSNTTLYAQWVQTFTVTYDGNDSTSGTVPTDTASPYVSGSTVTVKMEGTLARTGYAFTNWNTLANGAGTAYNVNDEFQITSNTILYAQWVQTFTVTYDGNDNTSGSVPIDNFPYLYGSNVEVLGNTGTLQKTGYAFNGWVDDSENSYNAGDIFPIFNNTTLYALWIETFTVTYNDNDSTSGIVPIDNASPYESGSTVTVLDNTGTLARTGYVFNGWFDGGVSSYNVGDEFQITSNTTLYPLWIETFTVTYNDNDSTSGSAPIDNFLYPYGSNVTVLTGTLARTGYVFNGWFDDSENSYNAGDIFPIYSDTTLNPIWIELFTVTYNGNDSTSGTVPTDNASPYETGLFVVVLPKGTLERAGYAFTNWNTLANGAGTAYDVDDQFEIFENTTLYAQWTIQYYSITYNGNGNTSGSVPVDTNQYTYGQIALVLGNTGTLQKTGFTFTTWNTAANGSGGNRTPETGLGIFFSVTLYAQWTAN
jgi:uncharacterized repeat protein (TIGR02543 family)